MLLIITLVAFFSTATTPLENVRSLRGFFYRIQSPAWTRQLWETDQGKRLEQSYGEGDIPFKRPNNQATVGLRIGQNVNTLWNNSIQVCIAIFNSHPVARRPRVFGLPCLRQALKRE